MKINRMSQYGTCVWRCILHYTSKCMSNNSQKLTIYSNFLLVLYLLYCPPEFNKSSYAFVGNIQGYWSIKLLFSYVFFHVSHRSWRNFLSAIIWCKTNFWKNFRIPERTITKMAHLVSLSFIICCNTNLVIV